MTEETKTLKRLYRSQSDRFVGGVCGGLGEYFKVDANIFRILFVVFTFIGGIGIILYIASLIIVPENPSDSNIEESSRRDKTIFWAWLCIIAGVALLLREFGLFNYIQFWHIPWSSIWAIFLIIIGIVLIISANRPAKSGEESDSEQIYFPELNKIFRIKENRMLAGVCAGIAEYFKIDPSIVRILWILGTLASVGLGILIYIILIFVFPVKHSKNQ